MKKINQFIPILLALIMAVMCCSCTDHGNGSVKTPSPNGFWPDVKQGDDFKWNEDYTPDIHITEIGEGGKEDDIQSEIDQGTIDNIESLVYSSVAMDLEEEGFHCGTGVAMTIEDDNYSALGIYYEDPEMPLFTQDSGMKSVGFVEIKSNMDDLHYDPFKEEGMIVVEDASEDDAGEDEIWKIVTYNYENISSYHFIYQDKYIVYYQQSPMQVVYEIHDNLKENYDLQLGSLYDYDKKQYIYDESIFGEYQGHSGTGLFKEEDYQKLEEELKELSDEQLQNGYQVLEYNIVYISPESIQAYLSSTEEDTFFGYRVDDLIAEFGAGTALNYNGSGFERAQVIPQETGYNWKSFLIKMGIGSGIILVGAILAPVTGGASFGCALLTISKVAISYALTSAIGTLAIETVTGLIRGESLTDAIKHASYKGLDSFANGFMIGAAVGSVGLLTGAIKPSACFVAGTPIAIGYGVSKPIENISAGDHVLSCDETSMQNSLQPVTDVFCKEVYETVELTIGDDSIETTRNHPFYSPEYKGWVAAGSLAVGDRVINSEGILMTVDETSRIEYPDGVKVYNFTVDENHTYYVGDDEILVHNECTTMQSKRNKAVKEAWKTEVENVSKGTSKYSWTPDQIKELLDTGKIKGYEGHHIVPVNELVGTARESFISDGSNIVFLSKADHVWVHEVGDSLAATIPRVLDLAPWVSKILPALGVI